MKSSGDAKPHSLVGILQTESDEYVLSSLVYHKKKHCYELSYSKKWPIHQSWRKELLLHTGVYAAVPSMYLPKESLIKPDDGVEALSDKSSEKDLFSLIAHEVDVDILQQDLKKNLLGIVSDDIFLLTIPILMGGVQKSSFVSVYATQETARMGIIHDNSLLFSIQFALTKPQSLDSCFARLKRYCLSKAIPWPETVISLNTEKNSILQIDTQTIDHHLSFDISEAILKASGIALAPVFKQKIPVFAFPTEESEFRVFRVFLYGISAILLCLTFLLVSGVIGYTFHMKQKLHVYERQYQSVLTNNEDIKKMLQRNNELSETILRLETTFSHQTRWSQFFDAITKEKPDNLFFERFGSEPVAQQPKNMLRIALSGWSTQENTVTQFISKLQSIEYLTQITLSSMERDTKNQQKKTDNAHVEENKQPSIIRFRIVCTLLLND